MASEWQPIETAPKDGTIVLLYIPWMSGYDVVSASWGYASWCLTQAGTRCESADADGSATHWMPLPEPPDA